MAREQRRFPAGILAVTVAVAASMALAACVGGAGSRVPASEAAGPALTVERFLTAANSNDLKTMTQLFGTTDRTIVELEGETRAEQRMYVLASLVRHDDYAIMGQQTVPGRMLDATELMIRITREDESVTVPFLVVRTDDGGWIIERIDVEPLTQLP